MKKTEKDIIDSFAKKIIDKGFSMPAIFFLESTKYISFIGGQALIFFGPVLTLFVNDKKYYDFIALLEKKENIEYLITRIEISKFGVK